MTTLRMAVAALVLLALSGCGGHAAAPPPSSTVDEHEETPAGARELDDALIRLVLVEPGSGATAVYDVVDPERAYVNDAAAQAVYEIDYSSGLRLARTLRTGVEPGLMVEAGR